MKKFTKQERKEIAQVFECCKHYLWDGNPKHYPNNCSRFICFAIDRVWYRHSGLHSVAMQAKNIIIERLGKNGSYEGWLEEQFPELNWLNCVDNRWCDEPENIRKLQRSRHLWVDALIKEFSE